MKTVLAFAVMGFMLCGCAPKDPAVHDELGSYHEFSVLQLAHGDWVKKTTGALPLELITREGLHMAAFPANNEKGVILVLLRPEASPFYKQYPPGSYAVSKTAIEQLQRNNTVSATVLECIKSHLEVQMPAPR